MHITLKLTAPNGLILPIDYSHMIQGAIYNSIDPDMAVFLHDHGFMGGGRVFKLFTFSRLLGRFQMDKVKRQIIFTDNIQLVIASPLTDFVQSLANGLLRQGGWRLGSAFVDIDEISAETMLVESDSITVKTLSPITVYSTMLRPDGRKYTVYFQPGDPDYDAMITANLQKKYNACYGQQAPEGMIRVRTKGNLKMNLLQYKGTVIKGYSGMLELDGPKELLQMVLDGGGGAKNSQGFGCVVPL